MTLETRAAFSRRTGLHKSNITRAAQEGRVVMVGQMVDVERSLPLLDLSTGNTAHGAAVRARHEATREEKAAHVREPEPEPEKKAYQNFSEPEAPPAPEAPQAPTPPAAPRSPKPPRVDASADAVTKIGIRTRLAQMRQAEADAELREIRLAQERSQLLDAEQVTLAWSEIITAAKGRLLALPQRLAFELIGISDPGDIERRIRAGITDALEDLARGRAPDG